MIDKGAFSECLKTGLYFTSTEIDKVMTGDLFWNPSFQQFQIRGIPTINGEMASICLPEERGPVSIMMHVRVIRKEIREGTKYTDLIFEKATVSDGFMAWLEEWYGDRSCFAMAQHRWEVMPNLTWVKS